MRRWMVVGALLVGALAIQAPGFGAGAPVLIGVTVPLSGSNAEVGQDVSEHRVRELTSLHNAQRESIPAILEHLERPNRIFVVLEEVGEERAREPRAIPAVHDRLCATLDLPYP